MYFILTLVLVLIIIYLFFNNKDGFTTTQTKPIGFKIVPTNTASTGVDKASVNTIFNSLSNDSWKSNNIFQLQDNFGPVVVNTPSKKYYLDFITPYNYPRSRVTASKCFVNNNTPCYLGIEKNDISKIKSLNMGDSIDVIIYLNSGNVVNDESSATLTRVV